MATKPLKTITFEGLEDTYTIPQIDDTLSVTGGAADAKATGDAISTKAEAEGAVSMAKALVGGKYTLDQSPYHYRQSPDAGSLDEKIVGGTLAWNQLCNSSSVTVQSGHKYLSKISGTYSVGSSTGTAITGLTSGTDMVFDLTQMFGSTIADYIYSLEQSSAGAGVAWVKRYIDLDTYHEYCEPTLKSVEGLQSRDVVGFNQWDEEWELGSLNNGVWIPTSNGYVGTKNHIPIFPNTTYYYKSTAAMSVAFYDANKTYLADGTVPDNSTFITPLNAHFMRFREFAAYGNVYKNDICINPSDPSRNGTYEPYEKHSYPLDSSLELRGIPKLSDGKMYFDGDEYSSDGQVVRRYGIVDLGTLNWSVNTTYGFMYAIVPNGITPTSPIGFASGICTRYTATSDNPTRLQDGQFSLSSLYVSSSPSIEIMDADYTDPTTFKTAMSGVMLVYELATPTTESAQPYQSPQLVGATEEYVTTGVVPVGHESRYYEDIVGKVNDLPSDFSTLIAPVEKSFTATRNYTVGSFVIVNNQLYKVSSAISSGGTITPNSNCTATTIMAEILALA